MVTKSKFTKRILPKKYPKKITGTTRTSLDFRSAVVTDLPWSSSHFTSSVSSTAHSGHASMHWQSFKWVCKLGTYPSCIKRAQSNFKKLLLKKTSPITKMENGNTNVYLTPDTNTRVKKTNVHRYIGMYSIILHAINNFVRRQRNQTHSMGQKLVHQNTCVGLDLHPINGLKSFSFPL